MKKLIMSMAAVFVATPAIAGDIDYSANSQAKSWNLFGEEKARFTGKVTDAICGLTGDCPDDCGGGNRQMVVIREDDDRMFLANKNGQPIFSGAAYDLAKYCGQMVEVDGLLVGDSDITPGLEAKLLQIQLIRPIEDKEFAKTNNFTKVWSAKYPEAKGKGPWFRRDPAIKAQIEKTGYFGLGHEVDEKYLEENAE